MYWSIIDKSKTKQPTSGNYRDWKVFLATEGFYRCVYCAIKDARLGGVRNFHVEHYKPRSKFPHLANDITNLYYACPICNAFKSDDWHDPSEDSECYFYPDPSIFDYNLLFELQPDGFLIGRNNCGKYIISRLGLNRKQLVIDRQYSQILFSYKLLKEDVQDIRNRLMERNSKRSKEILKRLCTTLDKLIDSREKLSESAPYCLDDTKK